MANLDERVKILQRRSPIPAIRKDAAIFEGNVKLLNRVELDSEVLCCRFNGSGKLLAIGLTNGTIMIYCIETRGFSYILRCDECDVPVTSLRWKPDDPQQSYGYVLMATYVNGEIRSWHVTSSECLNVHKEGTQLLCSAYNSSGTNFIVGGSDGKIFVYDEVMGKKISTMRPSTNVDVMDGHMMRVFSLQYNPHDDNVFVSGGWDNTIQWWDCRVSDKHSIKRISGPHVCGEGIDIERSTQNVVAASWRKVNNLQIYDFGSGKLMKEIPSYSKSSMLYCAQWKDRGSILVGGSHHHMFSIADYNSSQTIGSVLNLPGGVFAIDNNRTGTHPKIAASSDKSVFILSDDV